MIPKSKPQQKREQTEAILKSHGVRERVALLGARGYYKTTMGDPTRNDRGIYDDAVFLVTPTRYESYNFNTDPTGEAYGRAVLAAGLWLYKLGIHGLSKPKSRQYEALVQAGEVTVNRDGKGPDTGWFGINIHRGGISTTSSLGCQTVPPEQWPYFIQAVREQMAFHKQATIPYLLIET